jgi:hypothetical protein
MHRRGFVVGAASAGALAGLTGLAISRASAAAPTPAVGAGPFFPVSLPTDMDADLVNRPFMAWSSDARYTVVFHHKSEILYDYRPILSIVDSQTGMAEPVELLAFRDDKVAALMPHPDGKRMGVIWEKDSANPRFAWLDLETKKWSGERTFSLPPSALRKRPPFLSPDGGQLFLPLGSSTISVTPLD